MNKIKETEKKWMNFDRANRKMISSYDEKKNTNGLKPKNISKILVK